MKLFHTITDLEVGGAEMLLAGVLKLLRPTVDQIHVAYFYGNSWIVDLLQEEGVTLHKLSSAFKADARAILELARLLKSVNPDILHSHLIQGDWAAFIARKISGHRSLQVSTKHNLNYFGGHPAWERRIDAMISRRMSAVIAVSDSVAHEYLTTQSIPPDHIRVIPNGIDLDKFTKPALPRAEIRGQLSIPDTAPVLITVASLTEQKGHRVMFEALPAIVEEFPDVTWMIVGNGKQEAQILSLARNSGLDRYCRFLGNRCDVPDLLHAADLFVLPSLWEGFGIAALEAAAAGLPLVLSNTGGLKETFAQDPSATLVAPDDPTLLAQAISTVLHQPNSTRIPTADRQALLQRYDLKEIAGQWLALYRELLA